MRFAIALLLANVAMGAVVRQRLSEAPQTPLADENGETTVAVPEAPVPVDEESAPAQVDEENAQDSDDEESTPTPAD